jgi:hypothetical protein
MYCVCVQETNQGRFLSASSKPEKLPRHTCNIYRPAAKTWEGGRDCCSPPPCWPGGGQYIDWRHKLDSFSLSCFSRIEKKWRRLSSQPQPELLTLKHVILEGDKKRRWTLVHLQFVSDWTSARTGVRFLFSLLTTTRSPTTEDDVSYFSSRNKRYTKCFFFTSFNHLRD